MRNGPENGCLLIIEISLPPGVCTGNVLSDASVPSSENSENRTYLSNTTLGRAAGWP